MIGIIATFIFVYALIWIFERKKREIEAFEIGLIVLGPLILAGIVRFLCLFLGLDVWSEVIAAAVFAATTFVLLMKPLEFTARRAAAYTTAVFAFNITISLLAYFLIPKT